MKLPGAEVGKQLQVGAGEAKCLGCEHVARRHGVPQLKVDATNTDMGNADNDEISYSLYFCIDSGFAGCSGTTIASGGNLKPPFYQNLVYFL